MSKTVKTCHHVTPTSRGGSDDRENKLWIPGNKHEAYHLLFGNATPEEAIEILANQWTTPKWKNEKLGGGAGEEGKGAMIIVYRDSSEHNSCVIRAINDLKSKKGETDDPVVDLIKDRTKVIIVCGGDSCNCGRVRRTRPGKVDNKL